MLECEARTVLSWPLPKRREYLELIEQKRGTEAASELAEIIKTEWRRQHEKPLPPLED